MNYLAIPGLKKRRKLDVPLRDKTVDEILQSCEHHFKYTYQELTRRHRVRELVFARQATMYFLRLNTNLTLKNIGLLFKMDHTSVVHSINHVRDLMQSDEAVRNEIIKLSNKI